MPKSNTITIGGAAGMWNDSQLATPQLLAHGGCDYLVFEALAEITMAVLTKACLKNPAAGYARDVIQIIGEHLAEIRAQGIKVVTNAGGVNPATAVAVLKRMAAEAGLEIKVATVTGDDVLERIDDLPESTISANAYLGARPIAAALEAGADVVVTGRVVDSALVLGPLMHEFGWGTDDLDKLSAGSLAGHLLECGPQSTGGLLTDWQDTCSWAVPGYPIAEVTADGHFTITASAESDALIDKRTIAEQIIYEIGDPTAYLLPDVTCDWSQVKIKQIGPNRVAVSGARGKAPPPTLKVCAQIPDGYRAAVQYFVGGRDAVAKAQRAGEQLIERGRKLLMARGEADFRGATAHAVGSELSYGLHGQMSSARESLMWVCVHHDTADAVAAFVREFPSMGLAGPPGIGGAAGSGLPRPSPVLRIQEIYIPREQVEISVELEGRAIPWQDVALEHCTAVDVRGPDLVSRATPAEQAGRTVLLREIAHGRSGDKGASVNIGIMARHPEFVELIATQLTAEAVGQWLSHLGASSVARYAIPGFDAVNFMLVGGLGTSGAASLRIDPQGKGVAQQLLDFPVTVPPHLQRLL